MKMLMVHMPLSRAEDVAPKAASNTKKVAAWMKFTTDKDSTAATHLKQSVPVLEVAESLVEE